MEDLNTTRCFRTTLNLTKAISPAFIIDNYDWSSGVYSSWTESSWQDISVRMFLRPSAAHESMTLAMGAMTFMFSMAFVYFVKSRSHILFAPPVVKLVMNFFDGFRRFLIGFFVVAAHLRNVNDPSGRL